MDTRYCTTHIAATIHIRSYYNKIVFLENYHILILFSVQFEIYGFSKIPRDHQKPFEAF